MQKEKTRKQNRRERTAIGKSAMVSEIQLTNPFLTNFLVEMRYGEN